jgi:ribonuclease HI
MIEVFTDGACAVRTTQRGGWAYIHTCDGEEFKCESGSATDTTNNRMELLAVIFALEGINTSDRIDLITDSSYVASCINQQWYLRWRSNGWKNANGGEVSNRDLWERLLTVLGHLRVTFVHMRGHGKDKTVPARYLKYNDMVDELANKASMS